jgi:hypothetical protein
MKNKTKWLYRILNVVTFIVFILLLGTMGYGMITHKWILFTINLICCVVTLGLHWLYGYMEEKER